MGGSSPLERQWIIFKTLCARRFGATVKELAAEHGVGEKTIRRDLVVLQNLGFPVDSREGPHGRHHWVAEPDPAAPPLTFDISELLALYLARTLLEPLAGTIIWESTQSAFRKIRATLGEPALEYLDQLAALIHRTSFRDSRYKDKAQLIDNLMVAIEDSRIAFLTYQSARSTEPLTYDVYPYGLVYHRGSLYLVAYSEQHEEIRTFKIDRMSDVSVETLKFQKPADFDLESHLRHSLGVFQGDGRPRRIVIRFTPEAARYVEEHHWHTSQTLLRNKDGSLRLELELTSLEEVKSWVLSFGGKAVVEEPDELREEVRGELERMMGAYVGVGGQDAFAKEQHS